MAKARVAPPKSPPSEDADTRPFLFCLSDEAEGRHAERTDVILVVVGVEDDDRDDVVTLVLPQLDMEIDVEGMEPGEALEQMFYRITSFYSGLLELPPEYINDVQQAQIELIERLFLPFLGRFLGRNPTYWAPPSMELPQSLGLVGAHT